MAVALLSLKDTSWSGLTRQGDGVACSEPHPTGTWTLLHDCFHPGLPESGAAHSGTSSRRAGLSQTEDQAVSPGRAWSQEAAESLKPEGLGLSAGRKQDAFFPPNSGPAAAQHGVPQAGAETRTAGAGEARGSGTEQPLWSRVRGSPWAAACFRGQDTVQLRPTGRRRNPKGGPRMLRGWFPR